MHYQGKYDRKGRNVLRYWMLLAILMCSGGCANLNYCGREESWRGEDKQQHFLASAVLGAGITAAASSGMDTEEAFAVGVITTTGIGLTKEWYDSEVKKTCFSWKDLIWDIIGASVGATMAAAATE